MGYQQQSTIIYTDNQCAEGLANKTINMKRSKAMGMRFHWTQDKVKQGTYKVTWQQGKGNAADYFTKSHPPTHHKSMRSKYLDVGYEQKNSPLSSKGVLN
jgi:hypothetical protein